MTRSLTVRSESFPIRGAFRIARGTKTAAEVVVAEVSDGGITGRGECVPYIRYGETVADVEAVLEGLADAVAAGLDRDELPRHLDRGAARNALDCALWDLAAKRAGVRVWTLAGLAEPGLPVTAFTLSVDTPEAMAQAATEAGEKPLLKLKLDGEDDLERVRAVRKAAPRSRLIVDANEAWSLDHLRRCAGPFRELGVELIEQPLPAGDDEALRGLDLPLPLGADESFHDSADFPRMRGLYRFLNVKLDKCGGLTEALRVHAQARHEGFGIMVGCMLATSLAMAPALLLAADAEFVDLDGPLLLARDRQPGLRFEGARIGLPSAALWG